MGLFFPSKRVTPKEFEHSIRGELRRSGLTNRDIGHVSEAMDAILHEDGAEYGMDRHEKDQLLQTLRKHHRMNGLSDRDLAALDKSLTDKL